MGNAFCVSNNNWTYLNLWKTDENKFRVIQFGEFRTLLRGSDYTLIHKKCLPVFELFLKDELELIPIKIERTKGSKVWDDYYEMKIKKYITPEEIKFIDESGEQVWQYEHHLFVSEEIKNKLEQVPQNELTFSLGFSEFG